MDGEVTQINSGADDLSTNSKEPSEVKETPVWEKHDTLLHGGQRPKRGSERLLHLQHFAVLPKYYNWSKRKKCCCVVVALHTYQNLVGPTQWSSLFQKVLQIKNSITARFLLSCIKAVKHHYLEHFLCLEVPCAFLGFILLMCYSKLVTAAPPQT